MLLLLALLPAGGSFAGEAKFEVWAADQNGNRVYVLDPDGRELKRYELEATAGADRPHTQHLTSDGRLIFSANTLSNSVSIHRASDGAVEALIEQVGKAPHAAQPHPQDPRRAYVANIAARGKDPARQDRGETITELRSRYGRWQITRYLDLTAEPALADSELFPSRRPVLFGFSRDGRYLLVSLFAGGAAVVDLTAWRVTRAWGNDRIGRFATVVVPSPDGRELYLTAGNAEESWLHVFAATGEPQLLISHNLSSLGQDAHGAAIDPQRGELWIVHRASGNATIHPLSSIRSPDHRISRVDFVGATPDLIAIAPDGSRGYVSLRGPNPAPTIPFPLTGKTPGISILDIAERRLLKIVPLGDSQQSDFHGVAIVPVK